MAKIALHNRIGVSIVPMPFPIMRLIEKSKDLRQIECDNAVLNN
jgi:hypothetical protein